MNDLEPKDATTPSIRRNRLLALDILRGLAILLMLLVNNFGTPSQTPLQLRHAGWEGGVHVADMAFPWFLFCVGVAIPFSAASFQRSKQPSWQYDLKVLRRTLILLALGAVLDSVGDGRLVLFSIGVLQTIGIGYAIGALLYAMPAYRRVGIAAIGLILYWAAIKFVHIPGMGTGAFEENKNLIIHLNRTYLGQAGLWNLTRIIPTSALVLVGTAIGDIIRRRDLSEIHILRTLFLWGTALLVVGHIWSLSLPYNKPIWTPSYILLSAGTGTLLLGGFYYTVDIEGWRRWAFPLIVFGSNAILAYVLPILFKSAVLVPLHLVVGGWLRVAVFILFWWLVLWLTYRKSWFLRI